MYHNYSGNKMKAKLESNMHLLQFQHVPAHDVVLI